MRRLSFLVLASAAFLVGCDDPFGPQPWSAQADTVVIYVVDRAEYQGLPSAFDVINRRAVVVEAAQEGANWDIALVSGEGGLELAPTSAFSGFSSRSAIAVESGPFDAVERAPSDTARYVQTEPVPLELSRVYIVRSRRFFDVYGQACSVYGKIQPIVIDPEQGRLEFTYVRNPNCNDRSLVPSED